VRLRATSSSPARPILAAARLRQPHATVPSPCIRVCDIDRNAGLCKGCLRTLDEIAQWSKAPDTYKLKVWEQIGKRPRP